MVSSFEGDTHMFINELEKELANVNNNITRLSDSLDYLDNLVKRKYDAVIEAEYDDTISESDMKSVYDEYDSVIDSRDDAWDELLFLKRKYKSLEKVYKEFYLD